MGSQSRRILELEEGFGMRSLSPERGGGLPKDTQLTLKEGDLGVPLLCPFRVGVPRGQADVWPGAVAKLLNTALPKPGIHGAPISLLAGG